MKTFLHMLGYASALGGVNPECGQGPRVLQESRELKHLNWDALIQPQLFSPDTRLEEVRRLCEILARRTAELTRKKEFFIVTGGDHTAAIGTWSGVRAALPGPLGLIWVDAHMDSHTPETTESGRLHGMPLASLLGYGDSRFTQLLSPAPKVNPEQLCLIGVRSYEEGEARLLKKLGVRIYFMEEVKRRGLVVIFREALERVNQGTAGYGLSLDLDGLDPREAPGVDVPEPDGLGLKELCEALKPLAGDTRLQGAEIVEFDPRNDVHQLTERAIVELIQAIGSQHA